MSDLDRLREDRALRDAARNLFRTELAHMRQEATPDALGQRIANRVGARTDAASDAVVTLAEKHGRTAAAALAAALSAGAIWLARKPLAGGFARLMRKDREDTGDNGGETALEDADNE